MFKKIFIQSVKKFINWIKGLFGFEVPFRFSDLTESVIAGIDAMTPNDIDVCREFHRKLVERYKEMRADFSTLVGLVYSDVQAGKTHSKAIMSAIWREIDNGDNLLTIVITEDQIGQYEQTVRRLKKELPNTDFKVIAGRDNEYKKNFDAVSDALETQHRQKRNRKPHKNIVLVVTKNHTLLERLANFVVSNPEVRKENVLFLHDEADRASQNVHKDKGSETPTYARICQLRNAFNNHLMLHYTATPEAVMAVSADDCLTPNFSKYMPPGENYVSLGDVLDRFKVVQAFKDNKEKTTLTNDAAEDLKKFIVGEVLRIRKNIGTCGTFMVIPDIRNISHDMCRVNLSKRLNRFQELLDSDTKKTTSKQELIDDFERIYNNDFPVSLTNDVKFKQILSEIPDIMAGIDIKVVNQDQEIPDWKDSNSWIVIGGMKLSRGITVEGLWITHMNRNEGAGSPDTIMQLARYLGYRKEYLDLIHVSVSKKLHDAYKDIKVHHDRMRRMISKYGDNINEWSRDFHLGRLKRLCRPLTNMRDFITKRIAGWHHITTPLKDIEYPKENQSFKKLSKLSHITQLQQDAYRFIIDAGEPVRTTTTKNKSITNTHNVYETDVKRVLVLFSQHPHLCDDPIVEYLGRRNPDEKVCVFDMGMGVSKGLPSVSFDPDKAKEHFRCRRISDDPDDLILMPRILQGRSGKRAEDEGYYGGDAAQKSDENITIQIHMIEFIISDNEKAAYRKKARIESVKGSNMAIVLPHYVIHIPKNLNDNRTFEPSAPNADGDPNE